MYMSTEWYTIFFCILLGNDTVVHVVFILNLDTNYDLQKVQNSLCMPDLQTLQLFKTLGQHLGREKTTQEKEKKQQPSVLICPHVPGFPFSKLASPVSFGRFSSTVW